jgi:two-component sensor histidine kinase
MTIRPHDDPEDPALGLAGAVIASSTAPLVLLDDGLAVLAASLSFCEHFRIDPASMRGRRLFELDGGEWDVPQLRSLLEATAAGDAQIDAYEMNLKREDGVRRLVLNAQRLAYGDADQIRLLVAVSDVTEARLSEALRREALREKDDLLREKAVLLQEIQHRVANSLQIIASVLLQTARRANSEETRTHLRDAHNRVMSVAALQQQLAASTLGDVALRTYFTKLCQSIGASMIRDHEQLALDVDVDDSAVDADASISLGLIVTELVINALKHAFPDGRRGTIIVNYRSDGADWRLSVCDDGVGMPADAAGATPGLGTSIINALAAQQRARIDVIDTAPGTTVSVVHTNITAADSAASLGEAPAAV